MFLTRNSKKFQQDGARVRFRLNFGKFRYKNWHSAIPFFDFEKTNPDAFATMDSHRGMPMMEKSRRLLFETQR